MLINLIMQYKPYIVELYGGITKFCMTLCKRTAETHEHQCSFPSTSYCTHTL